MDTIVKNLSGQLPTLQVAWGRHMFYALSMPPAGDPNEIAIYATPKSF